MITERKDGFDIRVRLTPGAAADRIDGAEAAADGRTHLKARVRAVPEKGAANKALEALLAKALGAPRSAVAVARGATARIKTVRVTADGAALARSLDRAKALCGGET
ncbi:MAG: DUF167 domain-containing protein [Maricaulaceae bacterium]|nr:DUF167 domain-containing protein [Maricaulaceae bacterium]